MTPKNRIEILHDLIEILTSKCYDSVLTIGHTEVSLHIAEEIGLSNTFTSKAINPISLKQHLMSIESALFDWMYAMDVLNREEIMMFVHGE